MASSKIPASASKDIAISKTQQGNLEHLSHLLHLFNHRNKNQHRRSIWYRHFSTFRKQLNLLLAEISSLNAAPGTHLERSRKKKRDEELKAQIQQRRATWQEVFVPKWHLAFSQLVADGRFAVLGLVLMGILGEVCGVVGVTEGFEKAGDEEVRRALERFGREMGEDGDLAGGGGGGEDVGVAVRRELSEGDGDGKVAGGGEDLGVKFLRKTGELKAENDVEGSSLSTGTLPVAPRRQEGLAKATRKRSAPSTTTTAAKKTKRRKEGDSIDELFSGLG